MMGGVSMTRLPPIRWVCWSAGAFFFAVFADTAFSLQMRVLQQQPPAPAGSSAPTAAPQRPTKRQQQLAEVQTAIQDMLAEKEKALRQQEKLWCKEEDSIKEGETLAKKEKEEKKQNAKDAFDLQLLSTKKLAELKVQYREAMESLEEKQLSLTKLEQDRDEEKNKYQTESADLSQNFQSLSHTLVVLEKKEKTDARALLQGSTGRMLREREPALFASLMSETTTMDTTATGAARAGEEVLQQGGSSSGQDVLLGILRTLQDTMVRDRRDMEELEQQNEKKYKKQTASGRKTVGKLDKILKKLSKDKADMEQQLAVATKDLAEAKREKKERDWSADLTRFEKEKKKVKEDMEKESLAMQKAISELQKYSGVSGGARVATPTKKEVRKEEKAVGSSTTSSAAGSSASAGRAGSSAASSSSSNAASASTSGKAAASASGTKGGVPEKKKLKVKIATATGKKNSQNKSDGRKQAAATAGGNSKKSKKKSPLAAKKANRKKLKNKEVKKAKKKLKLKKKLKSMRKKGKGTNDQKMKSKKDKKKVRKDRKKAQRKSKKKGFLAQRFSLVEDSEQDDGVENVDVPTAEQIVQEMVSSSFLQVSTAASSDDRSTSSAQQAMTRRSLQMRMNTRLQLQNALYNKNSVETTGGDVDVSSVAEILKVIENRIEQTKKENQEAAQQQEDCEQNLESVGKELASKEEEFEKATSVLEQAEAELAELKTKVQSVSTDYDQVEKEILDLTQTEKLEQATFQAGKAERAQAKLVFTDAKKLLQEAKVDTTVLTLVDNIVENLTQEAADAQEQHSEEKKTIKENLKAASEKESELYEALSDVKSLLSAKQVEKTSAEDDLESADKEKQAAGKEVEGVKAICDPFLQSFRDEEAERAEEIESLTRMGQILRGADFGSGDGGGVVSLLQGVADRAAGRGKGHLKGENIAMYAGAESSADLLSSKSSDTSPPRERARSLRRLEEKLREQ
ncbi:unnamed protein product [Amoebophrya sp. A120]|nr:unnamed protein product [Amoebophrya sp. A120]|eukprot:GSA120T00023262001.1